MDFLQAVCFPLNEGKPLFFPLDHYTESTTYYSSLIHKLIVVLELNGLDSFDLIGFMLLQYLLLSFRYCIPKLETNPKGVIQCFTYKKAPI